MPETEPDWDTVMESRAENGARRESLPRVPRERLDRSPRLQLRRGTAGLLRHARAALRAYAEHEPMED